MKSVINQNNIGLYFGVTIKIESGLVYVDDSVTSDTGGLTVVDSAPEDYFFEGVWRYENGQWVINDQERYDSCVESKKAAENSKAKKARAEAYKDTDPLFFKAQRGEITMQEWLDAVQAVKDKYPYI